MAFLETPARFRRWLAGELNVPLEKINLSSLNSALQQQWKKDKEKIQSRSITAQVEPVNNKAETFPFFKTQFSRQKTAKDQ